jgi:hypothetical protein
MDLLFFGVIPLKSPLITVLPIIGIVAGIVWAYFAPLGGKKGSAPAPAMAAAAPPPMAAPPPAAPPPAAAPSAAAPPPAAPPPEPPAAPPETT